MELISFLLLFSSLPPKEKRGIINEKYELYHFFITIIFDTHIVVIVILFCQLHGDFVFYFFVRYFGTIFLCLSFLLCFLSGGAFFFPVRFIEFLFSFICKSVGKTTLFHNESKKKKKKTNKNREKHE